jgi:hypothetical protein
MTNCDEARYLSFKGLSLTKRRLRFVKSLFLLAFIVFIQPLGTKAQSPVEYSVYANIIYHFTKYVDWPEVRKPVDFVIGVIGDTPLLSELEKTIANKMVGNQRIVIKKFSTTQESFNCQILFLSEEESGSLRKIAERTADDPVLLLCEDRGAAARGACINFIIVAERLKLEINKNNIEHRKLKIANELLRLGTPVK